MKVKGLKREVDAGYAAFLAKRKDKGISEKPLSFRQIIASGANEAKQRKANPPIN